MLSGSLVSDSAPRGPAPVNCAWVRPDLELVPLLQTAPTPIAHLDARHTYITAIVWKYMQLHCPQSGGPARRDLTSDLEVYLCGAQTRTSLLNTQ